MAQKKLSKLLKKVTPSFCVVLSCQTIRLERALGKFLKRPTEKQDLCDIIYKWECVCKSSYIGQTKRRAGIRWCEHTYSNNQNKTASSSIFKHFSSSRHESWTTCPMFDLLWSQTIQLIMGSQASPLCPGLSRM